MKVLVTGAAGFIGSHVVRRLIASGCHVYALVRPGSDLSRLRDLLPCVQLVQGDLCGADGIASALESLRPERCIHAAWYVVPGRYLTARENVDMVGATLRLAAQLTALGCGRFVGIGTCAEYDHEYGYLSENTPTHPATLYGASKLGLHLVLHQLGAVSGMEVAWVRLFYQFGPWEDSRRIVPWIIRSLLADQEVKVTAGEQVRDFLHVEDVASAICAVADSRLIGPVNIGSGVPVRLRDVLSGIGRIIGRPELIRLGAVPYRPVPTDPPFVCANNSRLKTATGWHPSFELDEGLHQTIDWWRQHTLKAR
ncbi:NAD-dependent epimerase/dehydratase family protein [Candidatus Nitrospira bockiana]